MASILDDVRVFFGGADLALSLTKYEIASALDEKDVTTWRVGTPLASEANSAKIIVGGLESSSFKLEGNSEAGASAEEDKPADLFWRSIGSTAAVTSCPGGAALNASALIASVVVLKNTPVAGSVGDVWSYSVEASASGPVIDGIIALPPTVVMADGNGTVVNLGAVPAGKRLYLASHVVAVPDSGGSLDMQVYSDSAVGFPSPTLRLSSGARTAVGGSIVRTSGGAITDAYQRISWSVSGGSGGAFVAVAALAIY